MRPSSSLPRQQRELAIRNDELAALRQRRSGAAERAAVLEELHRRQEGVTAGVKEVLAKAARQPMPGRWARLQGLVADLLSVSVEMAPLIEVALGAAAQHVVARPSERVDAIPAARMRRDSPAAWGSYGR